LESNKTKGVLEMISKDVDFDSAYRVTKYKFLGILLFKKIERRGAY
jgi:hypothetical protein